MLNKDYLCSLEFHCKKIESQFTHSFLLRNSIFIEHLLHARPLAKPK